MIFAAIGEELACWEPPRSSSFLLMIGAGLRIAQQAAVASSGCWPSA